MGERYFYIDAQGFMWLSSTRIISFPLGMPVNGPNSTPRVFYNRKASLFMLFLFELMT
jgi:hypothetical protein